MKKKLIIAVLLTLGVGAGLAYWIYHRTLDPNVKIPEASSAVIYISEKDDLTGVYQSLAPYLVDSSSFYWVAEQKEYPSHLKPGRYRITEGWSNNRLINHLKAGNQEPLTLAIHDVKNWSQLAQLLGEKLQAEASEFLKLLQAPETLDFIEANDRSLYTYIIPDSYEFYWTASPTRVLQRFSQEADKFWASQQSKLNDHPLNRLEIVTLASIVEYETRQADEMPEVAELYLNRLEQDIKLQSDPTVIYAVQQQNPGAVVKRVLYHHLRVASPYNTYRQKGLPPGPIRIPSKQAILAVLDPAEHDYIFMVADPRNPGYHIFAKTLREHNRNRRKYIQWLERQGA